MPLAEKPKGAERTRTAVRGFAGLCLTTRPRRQAAHRSRPPAERQWPDEHRARATDRDLPTLRCGDGVAPRNVPVPALQVQDRLLRGRDRGVQDAAAVGRFRVPESTGILKSRA